MNALLNPHVGQAMMGKPRALATTARRIAEKIDQVNSKSDLRLLCRYTVEVAEELATIADHSIDAGIPTRYLGIDSVAQLAAGIPALGVLGVTSNPTVVVKIIVIRTDDTFAADFTIENIAVATIELIVGNTGCPASMFTTGICLPPTNAPILPAGSAAITTVTNGGGAARRFRGGFGILKLTNPDC